MSLSKLLLNALSEDKKENATAAHETYAQAGGYGYGGGKNGKGKEKGKGKTGKGRAPKSS